MYRPMRGQCCSHVTANSQSEHSTHLSSDSAVLYVDFLENVHKHASREWQWDSLTVSHGSHGSHCHIVTVWQCYSVTMWWPVLQCDSVTRVTVWPVWPVWQCDPCYSVTMWQCENVTRVTVISSCKRTLSKPHQQYKAAAPLNWNVSRCFTMQLPTANCKLRIWRFTATASSVFTYLHFTV